MLMLLVLSQMVLLFFLSCDGMRVCISISRAVDHSHRTRLAVHLFILFLDVLSVLDISVRKHTHPSLFASLSLSLLVSHLSIYTNNGVKLLKTSVQNVWRFNYMLYIRTYKVIRSALAEQKILR